MASTNESSISNNRGWTVKSLSIVAQEGNLGLTKDEVERLFDYMLNDKLIDGEFYRHCINRQIVPVEAMQIILPHLAEISKNEIPLKDALLQFLNQRRQLLADELEGVFKLFFTTLVKREEYSNENFKDRTVLFNKVLSIYHLQPLQLSLSTIKLLKVISGRRVNLFIADRRVIDLFPINPFSELVQSDTEFSLNNYGNGVSIYRRSNEKMLVHFHGYYRADRGGERIFRIYSAALAMLQLVGTGNYRDYCKLSTPFEAQKPASQRAHEVHDFIFEPNETWELKRDTDIAVELLQSGIKALCFLFSGDGQISFQLIEGGQSAAFDIGRFINDYKAGMQNFDPKYDAITYSGADYLKVFIVNENFDRNVLSVPENEEIPAEVFKLMTIDPKDILATYSIGLVFADVLEEIPTKNAEVEKINREKPRKKPLLEQRSDDKRESIKKGKQKEETRLEIFKDAVLRHYNSRPIVDSDDVQKGRWGKRAIANDKALTAKVVLSGASRNFFDVEIEVKGVNKSFLEGNVAFFLHNSFPAEIRYTTAKQNVAKTRFQVYEAFTVATFTEDGTMLELDLNEQKGYPEGFYYSPPARLAGEARKMYASIPSKYPNDTQKGRWGGTAKSNMFELRAIVRKRITPGSYNVKLVLTSLQKGGKVPDLLGEAVAFFIGNRVTEDVVFGKIMGGSAEVNFVTNKAFTVGALTQNQGKFELDINELPDLPADFYSTPLKPVNSSAVKKAVKKAKQRNVKATLLSAPARKTALKKPAKKKAITKRKLKPVKKK